MKTERIKKLLTMAFLSEGDNVRLGSLDAIKRLLASEGKDTHWLLEKLVLDPPEPQGFTRWSRGYSQNNYQPVEWRSQLEYVKQDRVMNMLVWREQEFIEDMVNRAYARSTWVPTFKQTNWLNGIYQRAKIMGAV